MQTDYIIQADFSLFASWLPSVLASLQAEDGFYRPQAYADEQKSTRGREPGGMQKGGKKSALIPYLDNIEITLMKIFNKTTEKSGKTAIFFLNRFLSVFGSTLNCDRILKDVKQQERKWGFSFLNLLRKVVDVFV